MRTPEERRAAHAVYMREWIARHPGEHSASSRKWRLANPEAALAANREWRRRNPEKVRAHNAVTRALRAGRLVRPDACQQCGQAGKVEASHDDYEKLLEVTWLCRPCHAVKDARPTKYVEA